MPLCGFSPERDERHLFRWFGPNGLTFSADLPATILNQVCTARRLGVPVTVNNRLVGVIHGAFTADLPTCHRQVHTVAHPGGDDVDERGNRRRLQPKPARLRLRADWGLRAGCAATAGAERLDCYGFRPTRRAQDAVAEVRHFTARSYESVVEGDIEACFDEISDPGLMGRVRRRIGDKRVLANIESKLAPAIFITT